MADQLKASGNGPDAQLPDWNPGMTRVFVTAIAIVTSSAAAYQAAASLGQDWIRWIAEGLVLLLCIGGLSIGSYDTPSPILDAQGKPERRRSDRKTSAFGVGVAVATCFLAIDCTLSLGGFFPAIEHDPPRVLNGGTGLVFRKKDIASLRSKDFVVGGYSVEAIPSEFVDLRKAKALNYASPHIEMLFQKRANVEHLVISDVSLTVHSFVAAPTPIPTPQYPSAGFVNDIIVDFVLKKLTSPPPWPPIKPDQVLIDGNQSLGFREVTVSNSAPHKLKIRLAASDPGIYTVSVRLELRAGMGAARSLELPGRPASFMFVPFHSLLQPLPNERPPTKGEDVTIVSPDGRMLDAKYEPNWFWQQYLSPQELTPPVAAQPMPISTAIGRPVRAETAAPKPDEAPPAPHAISPAPRP